MSSETETDTPTSQSPLSSNPNIQRFIFPPSEFNRPTPSPKPTRQLADYAALPEGWRKSKHYYHYGWPVSSKMMCKVLRQLPFGFSHHPDSYPGMLTFGLKHVLGFDGISVVLCKPDDFCQREERLIYMDDENKDYVQFVTIGCTYSRTYFWRRPDPEGLERLIKLFGEEPRWMENGVTKKRFCLWTID